MWYQHLAIFGRDQSSYRSHTAGECQVAVRLSLDGALRIGDTVAIDVFQLVSGLYGLQPAIASKDIWLVVAGVRIGNEIVHLIKGPWTIISSILDTQEHCSCYF